MKAQTRAPRDHTIDIVRGIAIVTMVGANLAILLPQPHSLLVRWYSSFAAPIFVTLAGTMMALAVDRNRKAKHPISYFIKRGLFLIATAALVDVVAWRFVPFMAFDVLYLLGFSLPALFLCAYLRAGVVLLMATGIFVLTPILQKSLGYVPLPYMVDLVDLPSLALVDWGQVAKHWLIDGWFPFFPWLGYGLFGIFVGKYRWHGEKSVLHFASWPIVALIAFAFVAGALVMAQNPGPLHDREGFSELFYPASIGFIIVSLSVVMGCMSLIDFYPNLRFWAFFQIFGEASLFMYTVHSIVIGTFFFAFWGELSGVAYTFLYAGMIVFLSVCGLWLRVIRRKYPNLPTTMKWMVGG